MRERVHAVSLIQTFYAASPLLAMVKLGLWLRKSEFLDWGNDGNSIAYSSAWKSQSGTFDGLFEMLWTATATNHHFSVERAILVEIVAMPVFLANVKNAWIMDVWILEEHFVHWAAEGRIGCCDLRPRTWVEPRCLWNRLWSQVQGCDGKRLWWKPGERDGAAAAIRFTFCFFRRGRQRYCSSCM